MCAGVVGEAPVGSAGAGARRPEIREGRIAGEGGMHGGGGEHDVRRGWLAAEEVGGRRSRARASEALINSKKKILKICKFCWVTLSAREDRCYNC
jgi:hypothetical protein